jgi:hypothetical protein
MAIKKTPAAPRKSTASAPDPSASPERTMFPLRLSTETLEGLDEWVAELNADPSRIGGKVARSHLIEKLITDAVRDRTVKGSQS